MLKRTFACNETYERTMVHSSLVRSALGIPKAIPKILCDFVALRRGSYTLFFCNERDGSGHIRNHLEGGGCGKPGARNGVFPGAGRQRPGLPCRRFDASRPSALGLFPGSLLMRHDRREA